MLRYMLTVICVGLWALWASPAQADDRHDVQSLMQSTIDKTLTILGNPALKSEDKRLERRAQVRAELLGVTDTRRVGQLVLGRQRSQFSEEQIRSFCDTFAQLVFFTYIANLEAYTDQKVRIASVEMQPESRAYVCLKIISDDKETPADFSLFKDEKGAWKCFDIKVEGVSLVSNYRSQFGELLLKETPEQVIADVRQKVKENEQEL